jgi:hypothetical protein
VRRARRRHAGRLAHAEAVERAHGVGREVDVGADAGELLRLLEHEHVVAGARSAMAATRPPMPAPTMPMVDSLVFMVLRFLTRQRCCGP